MPSPDLSQYFALDFYDIDPQSVIEAGMEHLQRVLPDLVLREGHIEQHLLEAIGEEVAESVFAINRLPDSIFEVLLQMLGVSRDIGSLPAVNIRFTVNRSDGCTIPEGTAVFVTLPGSLGTLTFTTTEDLILEAGETEGVVPALGSRYTADANGLPSPYHCELLDTIAYVDFVQTDSDIVGGRDAEDDEQFLSRGVQRLSRLSTTLVLPEHFTSAAIEELSVLRAFTLDNYNPANDADANGPVGNDAGHVTVAVYGANEFVSDEAKAALAASMVPRALSILKIHVIDAKIHNFDITAKIRIKDGADQAAVVTAVTEALHERYSTNEASWNETIRRNEIITLISQVTDVLYVESLTLPATDITLPGVATLPRANTISIEVLA